MPYSRQRPLPTHFLAWLLIAGSLLWSPVAAWAKGCAESEQYPAASTPSALWGELQPERVLVDATRWTGSQLPSIAYPITTSVDVEGNYLFQSFYGGFSIWDASNPANPTRLTTIGGWEGQFPSWPRLTEFTQIVFYMDVPEGNPNLAAVAAITPVGFSIWNTTSKTAPSPVYQDTSKFMYQVYAARIGGRDYAFGADFQSDNGLHVYDMTAAGGRTSACVENRAAGENNCPGIYQGRIGAQEAVKYVTGLAVGNRHFIAKSGGSGVGGIEIWEVTNPLAPSRVLRDLTTHNIHGLAMWTQGGRHYLALRETFKGSINDAKILDVTQCLTNGCQNLNGTTIWQQGGLKPYPESVYWLSTTFSRSGSTPFLYFGNHETCRQGKSAGQTEYLYEVSNAAAPREVTPQGTMQHQGETVDYWSWYYSTYQRGYSHFGPRTAKFVGGYLYRAGATLFDIHKWNSSVGGPPIANFTYSPAPPDKIYEGDTVNFTNTSIGTVTGLAWTFSGGNPPTGTASSVPVTFSTKGQKAISLTASNTHGPNVKQDTITVHQTAPGVTGVGVSPAGAKVCQPITLTANDLEGKPPLDIQWQVLNSAQQQVATGSGSSFVWQTQGLTAGNYTANVFVGKTGYPSAGASSPVTLGALTPLPAALSFTPTNQPFAAGTVTFSALGVAGATEWKWDFGDGTVTGWSNNPDNGGVITHAYTTIGPKIVKVWVRNCAEQGPGGNGVESAPLAITITQVAPLKINNFQAICQIFCDFSPTQAVNFDVQVEGDPTEYQYDWDGDGSYEQVSATKITSHTYAVRDTPYFPRLRLKRGVELTEPFIHGVPINVRPAGNPSVSVNGPSSGQVGQSYSFTATGSNCSPGATWTWGASGGVVTGNGSTVTIVWSSAGNKSVSASSGNCGTGTASININQGGGSVNGPSSGQVGQSLSFAATGCTGTWQWSAGDGVITGSGTSVQISWPSAGSKTVQASTGTCSGSKTVTINSNPGGLNANFTFTPANPSPGQAVSFNASASTGNPAVYFWEFGDGTTGDGVSPSHAYAAGGQYNVKLTVYKDCASGNCASQASTTRQVPVASGPQLLASFSTNANCIADLFGERCEAAVGTAVSFTSTSVGASTWAWDFGDGSTGTGPQTSHTFIAPGSFLVQLAIGNGQATVSTSRMFVVTGDPIPQVKEMVLPWIAKTVDGALVQSSDLYLHNPGPGSIDVTLEFRRRGLPETTPPKATRTIAANATLFVADVVKGMFGREDVTGFIAVKVDKGTAQPIVTSFNTTFTGDGSEFGQTIPGYLLTNTGAASTTGNKQVQHLVGLNDNDERFAYFGLSNPGANPVSYTLRFFDSQGHEIGTASAPTILSRYGAKQYQVKDIRTLFGVADKDDYRVVVESDKGAPLFPYAANLRLGSNDPSFVSVGAGAARTYLLGALSTPGLNNSVWRSDVVIANTSSQVAIAEITFTNVGVTSAPTDAVSETLQPGETRRLADVIGTKWNIRNGVGVLTIESDVPGNAFPAVQGESYENTNPAKRYGQTLPALTDQQAAGANQGQYLVGLRQDSKYRTTFWVFNPGPQSGQYDVVFRGLDGRELGRVANVSLGGGKLRQFNQANFPAGVETGFTVQILVKSGKVLAAAQVVNNGTNDPAYIQGETR
jgi:PKD repeat protein